MYRKKAHIHFIGIGGIGMSGIAKILAAQGYTISGCDLDQSQPSVAELKQLGCAIANEHNSSICHSPGIDTVVYSSAIKIDSPEIVAAQQRGIPTIARALMLAELMRTKYSIAIAGSHGKTTTTSMISHILLEAGLDPTVVVGGVLKNISSQAHLGTGDFLVAEADESDRSFLHLHPTLAIVTNIDLEHLETYRDLADVKATFEQFLSNLPFYGKAIVCLDDPGVRSVLPIAHIKTVTYGFESEANWQATDVTLEPDFSTATIHHSSETQPLGRVTIRMPGRHNVLNALAAIALTQDLGVSFSDIARALANFKGIERRFSYHGTYHSAEVFDDYGHHPKEIESTLLVARRRAKNRLIVVFQPHRFSRTKHLWQQFIDTLIDGAIDHLIITDIYPASEQPMPGVTAERLTEAIRQKQPRCTVSYAPSAASFAAVELAIGNVAQKDDLILLLGAGKINTVAPRLVAQESRASQIVGKQDNSRQNP